jgi:endogenous inhibitor of DNA gyrase (YacG/DUF329 family)
VLEALKEEKTIAIPGNFSECNMYKRVSEEDGNYPFCSNRCWADAAGRAQR